MGADVDCAPHMGFNVYLLLYAQWNSVWKDFTGMKVQKNKLISFLFHFYLFKWDSAI